LGGFVWLEHDSNASGARIVGDSAIFDEQHADGCHADSDEANTVAINCQVANLHHNAVCTNLDSSTNSRADRPDSASAVYCDRLIHRKASEIAGTDAVDLASGISLVVGVQKGLRHGAARVQLPESAPVPETKVREAASAGAANSKATSMAETPTESDVNLFMVGSLLAEHAPPGERLARFPHA
jgi:hypothetical protein